MKDADHLELEEEFHSKKNKHYRKEKKRASATDRSKFKKTDWEKRQKKELAPLQEGLKRGRVLAIRAEGILVDADAIEYLCSLKGSLKKEKKRTKNLIAVGDFVRFAAQDSGEGLIHSVEERRSILSRKDHFHAHKQQLIAVNIDQVLIITSLFLPRFKPSLVDRYIISALKGNMVPLIIINKVDLLTGPPKDWDADSIREERALFEEFVRVYRALGFSIFCTSEKSGEGLEELKDAMKGKASVFSGQSGVGKSSLINALIGSKLRIGTIVQRTSKGSHTTSTTELLPLEGAGFCIDTPGIRSFGMWDLKREEIPLYFAEIQAVAQQCKYPNCTHLHEPDCAVQRALEEGLVSPLRFSSYSALMEEFIE